jgi:cyclopropane-fatty-acyl-phospholipid synthase
MSYSSAVFPTENASLHEASVHKLDRICRKLDLQPTDHLLEIGTGWGGLAIHAASNYGCRVTTTTISREQHDLARSRIEAAGVADRVSLLLKDYRHLEGSYGKLVSVEMIEAVGHEHLATYFNTCSELLKPDGLMLIQAITMPDQRYADYIRSVDFIQRYVFPGGCLPSLGAIVDSIRRRTDLRMLHFEELAPHYAQTLAHWRTRFFERIAEVRRQGYSERFIRLWEYYLCYCEAAFRERVVGSAQLVFAKAAARHDPLAVPLPVASAQQ